MRKILFRAWDRENQCYHTPIYNATEGQLEELLISDSGRIAMWCMDGLVDESCFPDRFELEQFTGLTDRNGKEIYEGDVVELFGWGKQTISDGTAYIIFDEDIQGWNLSRHNYAEDRYDFRKAISNCVIVGNIHDKTNDNAR